MLLYVGGGEEPKLNGFLPGENTLAVSSAEMSEPSSHSKKCPFKLIHVISDKMMTSVCL